jgi:hypothetical protein
MLEISEITFSDRPASLAFDFCSLSCSIDIPPAAPIAEAGTFGDFLVWDFEMGDIWGSSDLAVA